VKRYACLLSGALLAACGSEDILVFEAVPSSGGSSGDLTTSAGGSTSSSSETMTTSSTDTSATTSTATTSTATGTTGAATEPCGDVYDCGYYFFCDKDACGTETGACEPRPVFCEPDPTPVCGCDGVTYWNDCLRRQVGVASSTPGECSNYARRCNNGSDCGVFPGYCARILPLGRECNPDLYPPPEGTCWAVPPVRPEGLTDSNIFLLCPNPSMDDPAHCVDTHWAITSQFPHIRISDQAAECPGGEVRP